MMSLKGQQDTKKKKNVRTRHIILLPNFNTTDV